MKRSFVLALLVAGLVLGTAGSVFATGSVTVATGGGSISADTVGGSSTALTGPVIAETDEAGMSTGSMILNAPAGFHFDTSAAVTITVTDNDPWWDVSYSDAQVNSINSTSGQGNTATVTPTATNITVWVTAASDSGLDISALLCTFTWSGIRVRPIHGTPLASGNITYSGTATGVSSGANMGTLTEVVGAPTSIAFVQGPPASLTAGATLSPAVTVRVTDQYSNPISGLAVTMSLNGGGTLGGTTSQTTDGTGTATFPNLTVSQSGSKTLTASISGSGYHETVTSASFNVTPGPVSTAQSTVVASPASVTANASMTSTITVTLMDTLSNPISGKTVTLAKTSGPGTPTITTVQGTTSASGVATFTVSSGTTGADVFTATDSTDSLTLATTATVTFMPWLGNTFAFWRTVTIDHTKVVGFQTNFPVLITITDAALAAHAQTSGYDITFTASDGSTVLPYERESYNSATGALIAWVNVPYLSSTTDTVLNVFYGNRTAPDQQNRTAAWDPYYKAVWHLDESGNGTPGEYKDSTTSANNAQGMLGVPAQAAGVIGNAQLFTPSKSTFIESAKNIGITNNAVRTVSFWSEIKSLNRMPWVGWGYTNCNGEFEAALRGTTPTSTPAYQFLWGYCASNDWQTLQYPVAE